MKDLLQCILNNCLRKIYSINLVCCSLLFYIILTYTNSLILKYITGLKKF